MDSAPQEPPRTPVRPFTRGEKSIDEPSILAQRYAELPSLVQPTKTVPVQPQAAAPQLYQIVGPEVLCDTQTSAHTNSSSPQKSRTQTTPEVRTSTLRESDAGQTIATEPELQAASPSVLTQQLNELKRFAMELANDSFTVSPQASPLGSEKTSAAMAFRQLPTKPESVCEPEVRSQLEPRPDDHVTIDFNETINSELVDQVQAMMEAMSPGRTIE